MTKAIVTRIIKAKKDALIKRANTAVSNHKKGSIKKGSVKDLYKDIENG